MQLACRETFIPRKASPKSWEGLLNDYSMQFTPPQISLLHKCPCRAPPMHPPPLTLLLKLAAAAAAGTAAFLAVRRLYCEDAVASLRRNVREAAAALQTNSSDGDPLPPPTVLVVGFRAHGKSSLVNTACRALAGESGPLLLRAEASPPGGGTDGTRRRRRVVAVVSGTDGEAVAEDAFVELVEAPPLPEAARLTKAEIEAAFGGGGEAECVLLVLRCDAHAKERNAAVRKLPEISAVVREKGLNMIVVLTNKKALRSLRQAEELLREVSFRARTDCVYFIENYTWTNNGPNLRHPPVIKNSFETHFAVLTIIRQCLEFIKLTRSQSKQTTSSSSKLTRTQSGKLTRTQSNIQVRENFDN